MATYLYAVVRWPTGPAPAGKPAAKPRATPGRAKKPAKKPGAATPAAPPEATAAESQSIGVGVGEPPRPVEALIHRDLAALVSAVAPGEVGGDPARANVRALRRDMKAHSAVL